MLRCCSSFPSSGTYRHVFTGTPFFLQTQWTSVFLLHRERVRCYIPKAMYVLQNVGLSLDLVAGVHVSHPWCPHKTLGN